MAETLKELYRRWLDDGPHFCECGCGEEIIPSYETFVAAMVKRKDVPRYLHGHNVHHKKVIHVERFGDCVIEIVNTPVRCSRYRTCEKYLDCLHFVVVTKKATGWKRIDAKKG